MQFSYYTRYVLKKKWHYLLSSVFFAKYWKPGEKYAFVRRGRISVRYDQLRFCLNLEWGFRRCCPVSTNLIGVPNLRLKSCRNMLQ